ncbi:MAG: hypothetical protein NZL93_00140 [Chthoniobacterales bacterium]|nr:hypothetical protein [Chthoniobacterales bacterium]
MLRYSGTENLARLLVEGRDKDRIESYANEIAAIVGRCLGGGRGDF